jgi:protoporphyrinogen oxidase
LSPAQIRVVVLGAGPAGLAAAYQLARRGRFEVTVVERAHAVGGNAGSFDLDGLRVDYGSHRLHPSCAPEILADIQSMLGPDLLVRPRHGRIRLRGRWVHFPLKPLNLALHLPPGFLFGALRDAVSKKSAANGHENFATVLEHGLGKTICRDFYFPYAEKIWGVAPEELDAEQARRRVSAGSFGKLARKVLNGVPGLKPKTKGFFYYPKHGYGQISEAYQRAAVQAGAVIQLGTAITAVETVDGRAIAVRTNAETENRLPADLVLSTIPLSLLARAVTPEAPADVLASAQALQYRGMILVYLVLEIQQFTEFDAHYFPGKEIRITRLSEPKNYAACGSAPTSTTVLCAELPCTPDESLWQATDEELCELVKADLARADLSLRVPVRSVLTRRLPHAYPIYTRDYKAHFDLLDAWIGGIDGLLSLGRQGLFVHDNTHHTLGTAYAACACIGSEGELDRARWAEQRREFERHVVED